MTNKEKMIAGEMYDCTDPELAIERKNARRITRLYNATTEEELAYRTELLKDLFGSIGENAFIEPRFHCDYGYNIKIGDNFYANVNCVILDICEVSIGNNVFFAPGVHIYAVGHPVNAEERDAMIEFGKPVKIGNSVWIGGGAIILPGVTIGDNTTIGAGSVVTKDIPSGVVAVGNPCRVVREIKG